MVTIADQEHYYRGDHYDVYTRYTIGCLRNWASFEIYANIKSVQLYWRHNIVAISQSFVRFGPAFSDPPSSVGEIQNTWLGVALGILSFRRVIGRVTGLRRRRDHRAGPRRLQAEYSTRTALSSRGC